MGNELLELEDKLDLILELDRTLDVTLDSELLTLDDELTLLLELDTLELDILELNTLELLLRELTEPATELDKLLLELAWLKPALDAELMLASELAELTTTSTELRLVALTLDELATFPEETEEPGRSPPCFSTLDADKLATADALAVLTAALAAKLGESPPPPPHAFNRATASQPRASVNARENLTGCI